ncbi:MAG TPA: ribbon-helix-helix protein, CopG family [Chloroflexota bacterium]
MIQRTTLSADAEDLELFRREARRRKVSLNQVLREVVHESADARRRNRQKRDFGLFDGPGTNIAQQSVDDEESPVRGRLRS